MNNRIAVYISGSFLSLPKKAATAAAAVESEKGNHWKIISDKAGGHTIGRHTLKLYVPVF